MKVSGRSQERGSDCPDCRQPLDEALRVFVWQGKVFPGLRCRQCGGLWPVRGEEIEPLRLASINRKR